MPLTKLGIVVKLAKKRTEKSIDTVKTTNYSLFNQKITFDFLKSHLWAAADILRGSLDPADYRQPIMTLLFIKRLNDTFEENAERLIKEEGKSEKEAYGNKNRHYFFIPKEARWFVLSQTSENIGEKIDQVCRIIERENPDLDGVLTNTIYNNKRMYPDDKLRKLISHFNSPRIGNSDLESTDIFGDAFEYLLEQFADETKKSGGNFFTPKEIVRLLVNLVEPKEGMSICDPTCGSGGMLIECVKYVSQHGGNPRNLVLEGQEGNYGTVGMCKMNMVLHGLVDFKIEYGDTLSNPKLVEGGKLKTYDRVLANFPFSMDWDNKIAARDPYNRFRFGNPPIVLVTDRKQLDEQIHGTFKACGFPDPISAKSRRHLQQLLSNPRGKTIMTTIQKFGSKESHIHTDEKVITLVDEGHRSQYKFNAEAMRSAMPNGVFFAFSGTPIDKKNRSTYKVFGPLLDKYSFEESKQDGATLKILYESRMPDLYVEGADSINQIFERVFSGLEQENKDRLKKEYVTKEKIAEAPARIRKICLDLIDHYTKRIEPNGYKAMLVAASREAAVTYKRELDKLNAPKSKIIMTSHLGEKGKDGSSWDEYFLTPEQREEEADRFKSRDDPTKILIVVDMLLVGYDVPIVQVMYLDKGLREHTLLQAIARVNRLYDPAKTYGLIVDYCGITKDLQKALAIFEEDDIKGALEPAEKELEELKIRHREAISFFNDIDKENDDAIIEKFEPVNLRDDFEYAFKMFSKALDVILPKKEAEPFVDDFKHLSEKRQLIRNSYGGIRYSLKEDGKKVQQLIDDHIRAVDIADLMSQREVTYDNFLGYAAKFKSERARTALVKNKARQIIQELAPTNPVYYEKLRERLEKIIEEEEKRRIKDASYFNKLKEVYNEALNPEKERKKLGFTTQFEFAVYELLSQFLRNDENTLRDLTNAIFAKVKEEAGIVGWKTKRSSEKKMSIAIYDILTSNDNFPTAKVDDVTTTIIELAKKDL